MPDTDGVYIANASKEDAVFLWDNFTEGTKWIIYEWGESKGVFLVGHRFKLGGKIRNHVTRIYDGWQGEVFLDNLHAKPYHED